IAVIGAIYAAKHFTKKKEEPNAKMKRPEVIDGGKKIKFVPGSIGLDRIKTAKIEKGSEFITVGAPARIIASITNSLAGGSRIVLFETPEINTLYSQYAHARNALTRASKNLKRLQDMYKNQVATEKDMIEVETEAGNSRAELAEHEGKLRALGFNPIELDRVKENVVWLISDVPEGDLNAVEKNKKVKIKFTSFPDLEMKGVAEAVGDTVDPLTRTVKVRISMPNPKQQFKPGMFAHVEFGDSVGSSFVIPFTAVFTVEGNAFAFKKIGDAEFEKVAVILGNSDRDKVEVMQGLSWNDEIVVSGTMLLKGLSIGY
ncbi:MAG TPA: efflux RND transporter periplasmic adaptor subunit, partial [Leptospiraceae bacterium]|nr:efflux RND transporter periplasmic adaptor subunit [Leptospiraceae bacterium]